ncbi:MAG: pYEATS domain-containing protein [Promethearchaeota archaeon]
MDKWIPLFQTIVWPLLILIIIMFNRDKFLRILNSLIKRIESGSEIQAGPLLIGQQLRTENMIDISRAEKVLSEYTKNNINIELLDEACRYFYLIHTGRVSYTESLKKGCYYFKLSIWIDSSYQDLYDKIDKVIYHLHSSFKNPTREIKNNKNKYLLETYATGEFNLIADVYLKGLPKPIKLSRYINLSIPKKVK